MCFFIFVANFKVHYFDILFCKIYKCNTNIKNMTTTTKRSATSFRLPVYLLEGLKAEAKKIAETFRRNLAVLFMNLAVTFNPDIIVAGGGVMQAADHFWDDAVARFRAMAHPQLRDTAFARAVHSEPGLLGACLLAKSGGGRS